mmetsp:Transcript_18679/g.42749  ORF Transcript_18679/g.42749 Transcript_18679/m.42749 type:complete len:83 (-) Transcript_18679:1340-1588(-)
MMSRCCSTGIRKSTTCPRTTSPLSKSFSFEDSIRVVLKFIQLEISLLIFNVIIYKLSAKRKRCQTSEKQKSLFRTFLLLSRW